MDWRQLQEEARMQRTREVVREEISAVLEDIRYAAGFYDTDGEFSPIVSQIIDAVQTKIKERGTHGNT